MKCRMDRMDILFPCYGALTAAATPVRFFQAPILINWTSRRVVLGALFTRSVAPTPIHDARNLLPESWRNAKSACTCGSSTRYLARCTALPVVIIFSREQENGPPAEHGEIRGLGGGDGCKFARGLARAAYLGLARPHEALHGWKRERLASFLT